MQIRNCVFLVTGGASGLGAETARMAAAGGAKVVICDLHEEAGREIASALGPSARFIRTDIASEADGQAAVDLATTSFGGLHVLVNCAGIGIAEKTVGNAGPHRLASFARVVNVNLIGTFNMIRLAAHAMAQAIPNAAGERGVIVNTASVAAFEGQIGQAAYAASKGGVVSLTLAVARDLARSGIRVMSIAPGPFETPMMRAAPEEIRESLRRQIPFPPRFGKPHEYAGLVRHIVENELLNGEVIRLDGAVRMAPR